MPKIPIFGNPSRWERKMFGCKPVCDSKPVLYDEPHKRKATKDFDFVQPRGYVDNVDINALDAFRPVDVLNESEARRAVGLANHNHLRKNQMPMIEAELAYRASLRRFNICGNCMLPINVHRHNLMTGTDVTNLSEKQVICADIPAHYEVLPHPTKRNKFHYVLIPETRIFNQQCKCGF